MKLFHGNCLDILRKIPSESVDLVLSDPPYGTTQHQWDTPLDMLHVWKHLERIRRPRCPVVLFGVEPFSSVMRCSNLKNFKYDWVWSKNSNTNPLNAKRQPLRTHELVSVYYAHEYYPQMTTGRLRTKGGLRSQPEHLGNVQLGFQTKNDQYYPKSVLSIPGKTQNRFHPSEKPKNLLQYLINTYTRPGGIVLDFCMGSGSTGIAAIELEREFIGIEIEKDFFEVAKIRIESAKLKSK